MLYGLQTHFNAPIGRDRCRQVRAQGFHMARIDAQVCAVDVMLEMVTETLDADLMPLVIVSDVERLRAVPSGLDVEWTNEPDGDIPPADYRRGLDEACAIAIECGLRLWAPALSNLDEDSFAWANAVRDAGGGWPDGMFGVSVHRYGSDTDIARPHTGFASRDNEVDRWLFALRDGKPFLVSEFGWGTFDLSEDEAAGRIAWEWDFWQRHGAYAACLYQINDGHGEGERFGVFRVDGSLKEAIVATIPKPDPVDVKPEPEPPAPEPEPPVPPSSVDLTSWPRRGATIANSLLDTRWDYQQWADMLGGIFEGRGLTQVNVLSALWPDAAPHMQHPFVQEPDGRWNLRTSNPLFYDRLSRYVEAMNRRGVVVQLCFLELYSWSYRKSTVPFNKALSPFRHNVNGVNWKGSTRAEDDATLAILPDAFLTELIQRVVSTVKGAGVAFLPGNEFPEKPVHFKIADVIKGVWPEARVITNRNEDTPGQYMNMRVGQGTVDMIAFHGWDDMGFLAKDFPSEPMTRPRTFHQFFDKRAQNGNTLPIDFSRVICSSDGSRSSDDAVNTYRWDALLDVFAYVTAKGGSAEHQSRAKMTPGARLDMVETDFLRQMANL